MLALDLDVHAIELLELLGVSRRLHRQIVVGEIGAHLEILRDRPDHRDLETLVEAEISVRADGDADRLAPREAEPVGFRRPPAIRNGPGPRGRRDGDLVPGALGHVRNEDGREGKRIALEPHDEALAPRGGPHEHDRAAKRIDPVIVPPPERLPVEEHGIGSGNDERAAELDPALPRLEREDARFHPRAGERQLSGRRGRLERARGGGKRREHGDGEKDAPHHLSSG